MQSVCGKIGRPRIDAEIKNRRGLASPRMGWPDPASDSLAILAGLGEVDVLRFTRLARSLAEPSTSSGVCRFWVADTTREIEESPRIEIRQPRHPWRQAVVSEAHELVVRVTNRSDIARQVVTTTVPPR